MQLILNLRNRIVFTAIGVLVYVALVGWSQPESEEEKQKKAYAKRRK